MDRGRGMPGRGRWSRSVRRRAIVVTATAAGVLLGDTGSSPAATSIARDAGPQSARLPWGAAVATVVVDPGLAARTRAAVRVFRYVDQQIAATTQVRLRPVRSYLTAGNAADFVQTVRLGDPGAGHLAYTWRYTTVEGVVHSDTIVRPGLPASGPDSFTRVLAHEAEMSVGVGECSDPGAVCYWTFGTSVPRLDATDRARLAEVRSQVEAARTS